MLAIDTSMIILRVVHIVTGVIWVGSLFVVVVFVQPSAAALGPAGAPFMSELRRRRFVDVVFIDAPVHHRRRVVPLLARLAHVSEHSATGSARTSEPR